MYVESKFNKNDVLWFPFIAYYAGNEAEGFQKYGDKMHEFCTKVKVKLISRTRRGVFYDLKSSLYPQTWCIPQEVVEEWCYAGALKNAHVEYTAADKELYEGKDDESNMDANSSGEEKEAEGVKTPKRRRVAHEVENESDNESDVQQEQASENESKDSKPEPEPEDLI